MTVSFRACGGWSKPCARRAGAIRGCSSRSSISSSIRRRPDAKKYFRALSRDHRCASARAARAFAMPTSAATLAGMKRDELAAVLTRARTAKRWNSAIANASPTWTCRISAICRTVLPGLFADAALRAQEAGFDGVELHYAHAYTMASFLSRKNTRDDGYGGTLENRARLPLEVFEEVRSGCEPDFVVGCRFLADECIDGGSDVGRRGLFRRAVRESRHGFHLHLARRQVRRCQAARRRRRGLSLYGAERL